MSNSPNQSLEKMETDSIPRLLVQYSLPAMMGLIAIAFYETVDRIFVGQFVGNDGLAVMAVGMPYVVFLGSCCIMLRIGGNSVLSRSFGQNDPEFTERVMGNSFALLTFGGLLLALLGFFLAEPIARLSGATEALRAETIIYLQIISLGAPFLFLSNGANAIMRATGAPRKGLYLIVGSCVANVILDAILVGAYDYGVPGAAWATITSQALGAVYGLWHFCQKGNPVRLLWKRLQPDWAIIREIMGVGFAYSMFEMNFMVVVAISNHMLGTYGNALALASIAVVSSCGTLLYMPATGLDEGMQPIVGYNFGANQKARVRQTAIYALGAGIAFFTLSFLIIQLGAEYVVAIFVDDNPEFLQMAARALRMAFCLAPLMAFMIVIPGILSALGEVRYNLILSLGIQILVQIPALLILPRFFGVDGVWMTFPLVDVIASSLSVVLLWKSFKRHGLLAHSTSQ